MWQPSPPERLTEGTRFDRIPDCGSGAVRFQIVDLGGGDTGALVDILQQLRLRLMARDREAVLAAIVVHAGLDDDGHDAVAVGNRLRQGLQQQNRTALGAHVTVAPLVKNAAATPSREHRGLGEADESVRMQVQADAADQGGIAFAVSDRLTRLVQRHQRGRAGGVDRHARPVQVKDVRDTVGGDAGGVACHGRGVDRPQVIRPTVGVIDAREPDVHATAATAERGGTYFGVLERLPAHLQQ